MDSAGLTSNEILQNRVDYWVEVLGPLGLSHWRIDVSIVDQPHGTPNSNAAVRPSSYYDSADLEVASWALDERTDDELDEIIVHELLHISFRDFWDAAMEPEYLFGKPAWQSHVNRMDHEVEGVIDRTARAIVAAHQRDWEDVVQCEDTDQEND